MSPESFGIRTKSLMELGISYQETNSGELKFSLWDYLGVPCEQSESVLPDGRVIPAADFFFEYRSTDTIAQQLYLFPNLTDLIGFYQLHKKGDDAGIVFTAIGQRSNPKWLKSYLAELSQSNKNLQVRLAFSNDLLGRFSDIRLACWLKNREVQFHAWQGQIQLRADHYQAVLPVEKLSLSAFCKASGFRTACRTLKSKIAKCYWEELMLAP